MNKRVSTSSDWYIGKSGLRTTELSVTMIEMAQLRIDDLLANSPIDPEAHLNAAWVERYAEMLDALPPVVVFDTAEGLLLADGYHRVAAARRCSLETIEAEVRRGSRHDALRYAAAVRAAQSGISSDAAASYIRRRSQSRWDPEC